MGDVVDQVNLPVLPPGDGLLDPHVDREIKGDYVAREV